MCVGKISNMGDVIDIALLAQTRGSNHSLMRCCHDSDITSWELWLRAAGVFRGSQLSRVTICSYFFNIIIRCLKKRHLSESNLSFSLKSLN